VSKHDDWKPSVDYTRSATEGIAEELDPSIHTGVGNPLSPYNDELLSEEEEKRIDDKGRLVTRGKLWSEASTGLYLVVALHIQDALGRELRSVSPLLGRADIDLSAATKGKWTLSIAASKEKPRFYHPVVGACLELPDDLALDDIKRQYVVEWLVNTVDESFRDRSLKVQEASRHHLAAAIADAANTAIMATGL
jgi:hypothetical protein